MDNLFTGGREDSWPNNTDFFITLHKTLDDIDEALYTLLSGSGLSLL